MRTIGALAGIGACLMAYQGSAGIAVLLLLAAAACFGNAPR